MLTLQDPLMPTRRQIAFFFGALPLAAMANQPNQAPEAVWREHQIDTPDGPLAYARAGQGPLLVLLPGGPGGSGWGLRHWAAPLTDRLTVLILDPIGRGRSARLADPRRYTLERDAADLERLRRHLGLAQLSGYGHSYGGLMAQAWGSAHPQRVLAPALVLSGRADRICPPAAAQEMAAALPHAQCHVFEGSGHRPFIEAPEAWAQRVAGFVRSLA